MVTSVSSISLKLLVEKLPLAIVLNYASDDYNGLVWGQEANPVAYNSEYIRERGAHWENPSKDWSTIDYE